MFGSLFKPNVDNLARDNNVKRLVEFCKHADDEIREKACKALREMDLRDPKAIGLSGVAIQDVDAKVRKNAALALGLALGKIGIFKGFHTVFSSAASAGLKSLISISGEPNHDVRSAAATALSQLYCTFGPKGEYDTKGAECLIRLAEDTESSVRVSAKLSLHFWALEAAKAIKEGSSSSFAKMFEGSKYAAKLPDAVDEVYKAPFRRNQGLNETAVERLGRSVQVDHERLKLAQEISRTPDIPDWQREFYRGIAYYWVAWFDGKKL